MTIELRSELGAVHVTEECIAVMAGSAAMECYGLVGMASRRQLRDGIAELLGKENWQRGVIIRRENGELHIDLYIIVGYGTKISEVAHNIQSRLKYVLNDVAGLGIDHIHIFVEDVMVSS